MLRGFFAVVEMAFRLFFRDKHGLFWGIAFPLMLMGLIGTVFGGGTNLVLTTSVVADAGDPMAQGMAAALHQIEALRIVEEDEAAALDALRRGDRSLVVVLPTVADVTTAGGPVPVRVYYDESNYEIAQTGVAIVRSVVDEANRMMTGRRDVLTVDASGISAHNLTMFDFLLPGVLAMVLMQNGLMGVTAVLTAYRERLLLKRVLATPVFARRLFGRFGGPLHHYEFAARRDHRARGRAGVSGASHRQLLEYVRVVGHRLGGVSRHRFRRVHRVADA